METLEKSRYRAWLLAIGADRWYECVDRVERMKIVEILEEEFASAKAAGEPLERESAFLAKHGIVISDVPVQVETPTYVEEEHNVDLVQWKRERRKPKNAETQGLPLHPAVALDVQKQRNSSASQAEGMSGKTPVHHGSFSSTKVQQNPEHEEREALSLGTTKGNAQGSGAVEEAHGIYQHLASRGWTGSWTWRQWNYNRVPPALEAAVNQPPASDEPTTARKTGPKKTKNKSLTSKETKSRRLTWVYKCMGHTNHEMRTIERST